MTVKWKSLKQTNNQNIMKLLGKDLKKKSKSFVLWALKRYDARRNKLLANDDFATAVASALRRQWRQ